MKSFIYRSMLHLFSVLAAFPRIHSASREPLREFLEYQADFSAAVQLATFSPVCQSAIKSITTDIDNRKTFNRVLYKQAT